MSRAFLFALAVVTACGGESDAQYRDDVGTEMQESLSFDLASLVSAAQAIQDSAPTPQGRGWDAQIDAVAIQAMENAWRQARSTYERIEGAVALDYPDLDFAIDSRYEQYLSLLGPAGDTYAFDDQGVVGLDAIERIVWSNVTPQTTTAYEQTLSGYAPAAFPSTEQEAADFKNLLCAKLVADAIALQTGWNGEQSDVGKAFAGLVALIGEQRDELVAGQNGAAESRYSQTTMDDLRSNIDGVQAIYGIFRPWLASKSDGTDVDDQIETGLQNLGTLYAAVPTHALPPTASADYTALLATVTTATDATQNGSLTFELSRANELLGL